RNVQGDPDPLPQVAQHNLRRILLCIDRCPINSVAARRVSAIRPIQEAVFEIELQIDRLRQSVEEHFDVGPIGRDLALWDLDTSPKNAAHAGIILAFLRPIDLSTIGINGYADAPLLLVATGTRITLARVDQGLDLG